MCPGRVRNTRERGTAVDINKLNTGEKVIGVSGILLLIFSFFPWLGFSYRGFSDSSSAWSFTLCWLAVILGVLMAGYVIAKAAGVDMPELGGLKWAHMMLGIAIVVFVFILIKVIVGPSTHGVDISGIGVSKDRKIGIFLGPARVDRSRGRCVPQRQGDRRPAGQPRRGLGWVDAAPALAAAHRLTIRQYESLIDPAFGRGRSSSAPARPRRQLRPSTQDPSSVVGQILQRFCGEGTFVEPRS